ncbi:MAG: ABC transporter ATP-binding protein, partial [Muribaculaceae bacterium]|nr:ABC transporter ATP-binding protein [Muribaculaceae bacterium]
MKRILPYIHYLWRITDGFHRTATVITLLGVLRVGVILLFIWLSKSAIDCAVGRMSGGADTLVTLFSMMVVCMISDVLISQWTAYAESRATMRMRNSVNRRLYNALMTMPLVNGQQGFHSGDMLNRLTIDVRTVTTFALSQLPNMVVMLVQLLGAFVFLAWLNPYLALAPIVIMPVCILASKMFFRRQRRLTTRIRQGESDMHVSIQEGLKNRMLLRTLECIDEMDYRLSAIQHKLDSTNKQQTRLSTVSGALVRVGFVLGYLTAFGWSIFSLKVGVITFGTMMAFIQLVNRIQRPIAGISGYIPAFISTSVAIDRLSEIDVNLTTHQPHHPVDNQTSPQLVDAPLGVRVSDMSFRYEADGHDILSS